MTVKSCPFFFSPGKIELQYSTENEVCALSNSGSDCELERYPFETGIMYCLKISPGTLISSLRRHSPFSAAPPCSPSPLQLHSPCRCLLGHNCAGINWQHCPSGSKGCSDFMRQRGKRQACSQLLLAISETLKLLGHCSVGHVTSNFNLLADR